MKVLHLISALTTGGAEMMLYKLLGGMDRARFQNEVISLADVGPMGKRIHRDLGIPVRGLGMSAQRPGPRSLSQLVRWVREAHPDVIQGWMYHGDLASGLTGFLSGRIPVVWNIRHSVLDPQVTKRRTLWIARINARLSHLLPKRIICGSEAARTAHIQLGYAERKMVVLPNGFDLQSFRPDPLARTAVRKELCLSPETPLIGLIARYDPQKDHATFVKAAAILHKQRPDAHFVLAGRRVEWENETLADAIRAAGLAQHFHLLGPLHDIPQLTAALDIATSSSVTEGFSNTIGEAMACGVPCVVTDVGDSALIVGDTGIIVPPRVPQELASGLLRMVSLAPEERQRLGREARRRVEENFDLSRIVSRYEATYEEIASHVRHNRIS